MSETIKRLLERELGYLLLSLRNESCRMTDSEAMKVIAQAAHQPMNLEEVLAYLEWSEVRFKDYVSRGLMPQGVRRSGEDGLWWYRDEINDRLIVLINE